MSKRSDRHERIIAEHLNTLATVDAERPVKGTDYSDVLLNYRNKCAWLEVKMSHTDNLANPRVYYHDKTWKTRYSTPVAGNIVQDLNNSETARDFVYQVADFGGLAYETLYIPTLRSEANNPEAVPREVMKSFCRNRGTYIIDFQDKELTEYVTSHYILGKTEPAFYMQAGDDFYMISNTNPLGLSSDIPQLQGTGKYRVRVSNRSKFYEVQAEIKMKNLVSSDFSVLPGTNKQNPFM